MNSFKTIIIDESDLKVLIYILENISVYNMPYYKIKTIFLKELKEKVDKFKYDNIKSKIEIDSYEILEQVKQSLSNVYIDNLINEKSKIINDYFKQIMDDIKNNNILNEKILTEIQQINFCKIKPNNVYIDVVNKINNIYMYNSIEKLSNKSKVYKIS